MDISKLLLHSTPGRLTCICVAQTTDTAEELAYGLWWPLPHVSFPFWFATVINHSLKCAYILSVPSSPSAMVLSLPSGVTLNTVLHVVVVPSHKIISLLLHNGNFANAMNPNVKYQIYSISDMQSSKGSWPTG